MIKDLRMSSNKRQISELTHFFSCDFIKGAVIPVVY